MPSNKTGTIADYYRDMTPEQAKRELEALYAGKAV